MRLGPRKTHNSNPKSNPKSNRFVCLCGAIDARMHLPSAIVSAAVAPCLGLRLTPYHDQRRGARSGCPGILTFSRGGCCRYRAMPLKDFNSVVMIETAVPIIVTSRAMTKGLLSGGRVGGCWPFLIIKQCFKVPSLHWHYFGRWSPVIGSNVLEGVAIRTHPPGLSAIFRIQPQQGAYP